MSEHLLLIDASGYAHRAYHTNAPRYRERDGMPTWATLGFMIMLWRMLGAVEADKPTLAAAVFDAPGKNFRHELFPDYKAHRDKARNHELAVQIPYMHHVAETLGIKPIEHNGYEADDVIATMAGAAAANQWRTTIVSSDKDFAQLVRDGVIEIVDPMKRARVLERDVEEKFGVPPDRVAHVQALAGDSVDNIPGIPGIGLDKAAKLIRVYGSVNGVLDNIKKVRWPEARAQLKRNAQTARMCLELTTLRQNVRLNHDGWNWEDFRPQSVMRSHIEEMLRALEAGPSFRLAFSREYQLIRVVDKIEDPLKWWREELKYPGQKIPDDPQCGFYERRLVRNGPFVSGRIWREPEIDIETNEPTGKELLRCTVGEKMCDPVAEWNRLAMKPIPEASYHYEIADADHAKKYRPTDPKASPHKPIDILKAPMPRNPKAKAKRKSK